MRTNEMPSSLLVLIALVFLTSLSSTVPLIPGWEEEPLKYQMEIFVICDKSCMFNLGNVERAKSQLLDMFALTNKITSQLNLEVVVVGLEFWDKYSWMNSTGVSTSSIVPFQWTVTKNEYYLNKTFFDDYLFLTGMKMEGSSLKGRHRLSCLTNSRCSGVVLVDQNPNQHIMATVLAHEIGHGLGLEHDDGCCHIGYGKCIMAGVWSLDVARNPEFSPCAKTFVGRFLNSSEAYSLRKPVAPATVQVIGTKCGNGVIEDGEQCDCGASCLPLGCCNCCRQCKLVDSAQCASGKCCNSNTCKFKSSRTLCRKRRDQTCDIDDFCSGSTSECIDSQTPDWTDCKDFERESGYCQKGFCNTLSVQCRFIWGEGYRRATENCYQTLTADSYLAGKRNECKTLICASDGKHETTIKGRNPQITNTYHQDECILGNYLEVEKASLGLSGVVMIENGTRCGQGKACFAGVCISKQEAIAKIQKKPVYQRKSAYCGNGHVDSGEDCDCGPGQCSCCDLKTCKFRPKNSSCLDSCGLCNGASTDCMTKVYEVGSPISDFKQCEGDFTNMCYNGTCVGLTSKCRKHFKTAQRSNFMHQNNRNQAILLFNSGGFYITSRGTRRKILHQEYRKGEDCGVCGILHCRTNEESGYYSISGSDEQHVNCLTRTYPVFNWEHKALYYRPPESTDISLPDLDSFNVDVYFPMLVEDGTPCALSSGRDGYCRTFETLSTKYPSIKYQYSKCTEIPVTSANSRYQFNPFGN